MSKKGVKIQLKDIQVNKENFRHSPLNNELDAIHYLITEDYESYFNLAKEIQKDCRTFTALMLERNGNKILMDANRRISVLKIFENPTLIPEGNQYDDLRNMCIANGSLGIYEITADIYYDTSEEDKNNLLEALNELHVKDNKTKKDWNALSQYRASQFIGSAIKHPWIKTLEYYGFTDEQIIQMTYKKTDIFNRIIRKGQLKILENGKINLQNDDIIISKICEIVKNKAYYIGDSVQTVDTRTKTHIYRSIIDDLIKKYSIGQVTMDTLENEQIKSKTENKKSTTIEEQINLNLDEQEESKANNENTKSNIPTSKVARALKRDVEKRNTVISIEQKNELFMTSNEQVNQIAHELSILNLNTFPISAPILLRSFLQYSFEWYANTNDISYDHNNLVGTINSIMNKSFENKKITREEKGTLKMFINKAEIINLLNEVTHNFESTFLSSVILIDFYDSIHPLMKNIYKS